MMHQSRRPRLSGRAHFALVAAIVVLLVIGLVAFWPSDGTTAQPRNRVATRAQVQADVDAFGIKNIKPTLQGGTIWTSNWKAKRSFDGVDPKDRWFDADHGSASFKAGDGRLKISGLIPRMYVHDPRLKRQWRDVEVTMYFKRVADAGVPYAGMTAITRSNHLVTEDQALCDTRGYGARIRYDGHIDFEKETAFPDNDAIADKKYWKHGMPKNEWIGYKFLTYDVKGGVRLQMWIDRTNGKNGGTWRKVNQITDDGKLFGTRPCAPGINPRMALTNAPDRAGSESRKPNVSVYFRSDGVAQDGLVYKWGSVREIKALPS